MDWSKMELFETERPEGARGAAEGARVKGGASTGAASFEGYPLFLVCDLPRVPTFWQVWF